MSFPSLRPGTALVLTALVAALCASWAEAQIPNHATVLFRWKQLRPGAGNFATYTYDASDDSYYVSTFGDFAGLHHITRNAPGDPWQSNVYVDATDTGAFPSDMLRFIRSSDVVGGVVNTGYSGTSNIGGMLLNPKPITVTVPAADALGNPTGGSTTITYGVGELAVVTDGGLVVRDGPSNVSSSPRLPQYTKKIYTWDLRKIGDPTSAQPDYSTGTSGAPSPNENPGGLYGAVGQADWNDVFRAISTEQDVRNAYAAETGLTAAATGSIVMLRQSAWSSDGQSIYTGVTSTGAGLYKIGIANQSTEMIYSASPVISDVAVLATSVRNLGSGFGAGDQVLFDSDNGALSYVVDNGASVSGVHQVFSAAAFNAYAEIASPTSIRAIATDSEGTIYFYDNSTGGLHRYDSAGRFSAVMNKAEFLELNANNPNGAQTLSAARGLNGGIFRMQTREEGGDTYLTFRANNDYVAALRIFDPGDVNRDGSINQGDRDFFATQFNKTYHGGAPDPASNGASIPDYLNYVMADLNGNGNAISGNVPGLTAATRDAVTLHDLDILSQFIDLDLGDFNWNGTPLDTNDWSIFNSHFDIDPGVFGWDDYSWFDGDVSGTIAGVPDGLVNQLDLDYLLANQAAALPEPGSLVTMGVALFVVGFATRNWRRHNAA